MSKKVETLKALYNKLQNGIKKGKDTPKMKNAPKMKKKTGEAPKGYISDAQETEIQNAVQKAAQEAGVQGKGVTAIKNAQFKRGFEKSKMDVKKKKYARTTPEQTKIAKQVPEQKRLAKKQEVSDISNADALHKQKKIESIIKIKDNKQKGEKMSRKSEGRHSDLADKDSIKSAYNIKKQVTTDTILDGEKFYKWLMSHGAKPSTSKLKKTPKKKPKK